MSNATKFGKVAVLLGGKSAERAVSLDSGQAVLDALLRSGVQAEAFDPQDRSVTELVNYDRAFIVLHGRGGEDGQIQGVLEWLNIPYTGTGVQGSAIGMDKVKTKQIWQGSDLPTAPYRIITKETDLDSVIAELGLPVIIKPVHEGSSVGMSKVEKAEDFAAAIEKATQHDAVVMAEKWITGREFTISFLNGQPYQLFVCSHQQMLLSMTTKQNINVMMLSMAFLVVLAKLKRKNYKLYVYALSKP